MAKQIITTVLFTLSLLIVITAPVRTVLAIEQPASHKLAKEEEFEEAYQQAVNAHEYGLKKARRRGEVFGKILLLVLALFCICYVIVRRKRKNGEKSST